MTTLILFLPYPPSVNTYWRHPGRGKLAGRHLISVEGRKYRKAVIAAVLEQLHTYPKPMTEPLHVHIWACAPDKRRRDLDNLPKAVFDACTHAGVWRDDNQIQKFTVEWAKWIPYSTRQPQDPTELQLPTETNCVTQLNVGSIALKITPIDK